MSPPKNRKKPEKSISLMALELLYNQGPMTYPLMTELIQDNPNCGKIKAKSVHTKLLEMEKRNLVTRDEKGVWYLIEGVTPNTLYTGELEMTTDKLLQQDKDRQEGSAELPDEESEEEEGAEEEKEPAAGAKPGRRPSTSPAAAGKAAAKAASMTLDQRGMFIKHMSDIGVAPKEAIPTIADIFFSGNINDLSWLDQVLKRHAAGYVTAYQRNLIMGFWAKTRGLPYSEDEEDWAVPETGSKKAAKAKAEEKEEKAKGFMDPGMGWKVGKDKAGDWVPQVGGTLTYEEALDRAERRATIAAYSQGEGQEEGAPIAEGEPAPAARKGKGGGQTFVETMMLKMMDNMFDGRSGKDSESNAKVEALEAQIAQMRDDRLEERFERMEGLVAQAMSRNPWDDFNSFDAQARRYGYVPNTITDNSPAVQIIKDTSEKLDKNTARLLGIFERVALKSEEFSPESTRTPAQREEKAEKLLHQAETRDHSVQLRKRVFGR